MQIITSVFLGFFKKIWETELKIRDTKRKTEEENKKLFFLLGLSSEGVET